MGGSGGACVAADATADDDDVTTDGMWGAVYLSTRIACVEKSNLPAVAEGAVARFASNALDWSVFNAVSLIVGCYWY